MSLVFPLMAEASESINNRKPAGFEDFFKVKDTSIRLKNLDGTFTDHIVLSANYQSAKISSDDIDSRNKIIEYLINNNVKKEYHEEILSYLESGVSNQSLCQGYISHCQVKPDTYEMVYNNSSREIYFFVNESILDLSHKRVIEDYHSPYDATPGLTNSFDMYFSAYAGEDASLTLNDQATLGLSYGYLTSNFSLGFSTEYENQMTTYDLSYNLDWDDKFFKVGYFQYIPAINTTDFLSGANSLAPQTAVVVGSSRNMVVGGHGTQKQLSFYSPQGGDIEVLRDGRIIYQSQVVEGQNTISYSQLPVGRYEVELVLHVGGEKISQGNYFVFNNASDVLAKGEFDYMLSFGQLVSGHGLTEIIDQYGESIEHKVFVQGRLTYQFLPSLMLGAGSMVTAEESSIEAGLQYAFTPFNIDTSLSTQIFEDGQYISGNISSKFGALHYEKLNNEDSYLATYLHNDKSFERLYWTSNYRLNRSSSIYAIYTVSKYEIDDYETDETSYDDIVLGYRYSTINNSTFDISFKSDTKLEESSIYFTWTLPLSDSIKLTTSLSADEESVYQISNSLTKDQVFESDDINNYLSLSNSYERSSQDLRQTGMFTANTINSFGRMGGSIYASSDGNFGVSGTLSSTQVFSDENYFSSKSSRSYLILDIEDKNGGSIDQLDKGYITVKRDGQTIMKKMVTDETEIMPLSEYSQYDITFDTQSIDIYNTGDSQAELFAKPGTVKRLSPKVHRTISFISGFNDLNEKTVSDVSCQGDGCISVSEMAQGVYRVTVLEGMDFNLNSGDQTCFIPENNSIAHMNLGRNYCLPTEYDNVYAVVIDGKGYKAAYLGLFDKTNVENNELIKKLESYNYKIVRKDIGPLSAIYIAQNEVKMNELFANYKTYLDRLKSIAQHKYDNNMTYPIVSN